MATWGAFLATMVAVAAPPGCLAYKGQPPRDSQCAASGTGVHFHSSSASAYTGLQARVHFSKWGDGVFSSINNLSNGAVELVFAESARNATLLQVGWSGDAALSFSGVRALVQRTAYRANGLAGEAELRVEFNRSEGKPCFQDCSDLETHSRGAVLILMMYRDTDLSENGSPLAAFLDGVASSDLEKVHEADFDPSTTDRGDHVAAYFPMDPLAVESGCDDIVHIVQLKPVPSASIPAKFCESLALTGFDLSKNRIEHIWLSTRRFLRVGQLSMEEMHTRKVAFFRVLVLVNVGLLCILFLLEWRKRHLQQHYADPQSPEEEELYPYRQADLSPDGMRIVPLYEGCMTKPSHRGVQAPLPFIILYGFQELEDKCSPAVAEYLDLLDAQETCHWGRSQRSVCLVLHFIYVALCLSEPIRDEFYEQGAKHYQGIPWEAFYAMGLLFVVSKIFELLLIAKTNTARGHIRYIMLPIEFMAGAMSFLNSYTDIRSIVVARACLQAAWWGAMMVVFTLGVVVLHWTLLVVLSLCWDRSNKCLYKILHMSVLAGSLTFHPDDSRAWYLWCVICWSQIIVQDILMGGLQLWYWLRVEHSGTVMIAIIFTIISFILSVHAAVNPTVTGWQDLEGIRILATLQEYMKRSIEDYDKTEMRILLEESYEARIVRNSPTWEKAVRFQCEHDIPIQEGSAVRAFFPVHPAGKSSRPYPAKVVWINYNTFTVTLKFEVEEISVDSDREHFGWDSGSRNPVDLDRRFIVENLDLTAALIDLGIYKENDPRSMRLAERLPPWECQVMKSLHGCQRNAIKLARKSAKILQRDALIKLRKRLERLDLVDCLDVDSLDQIFAWVLWDAPIMIHIDLDTVGRYLMERSYYRNQLEPGGATGLNILPIREGWEEKLFGECYKDALPFERPKYGVLDIMNDPDYGGSYAILKQARFRCTLTPRDSSQPDVGFEHVGTLDMCAHVLLEFSDEELREVHRVATYSSKQYVIGDSRQIEDFTHKELQLHGELNLKKDVKRLVVDPHHFVSGLRHDGADEQKLDQKVFERLCQEHGWELSYSGDPDNARAAGLSEGNVKWEKDLRMEQNRRNSYYNRECQEW